MSFLFPKHAPNGPKIMIKVKGRKNLDKDSQITIKKGPHDITTMVRH